MDKGFCSPDPSEPSGFKLSARGKACDQEAGIPVAERGGRAVVPLWILALVVAPVADYPGAEQAVFWRLDLRGHYPTTAR